MNPSNSWTCRTARIRDRCWISTQAKSDKPTPVVFYIHGGGWQGGDKKTNPKPFLDKGVSVVAINYRYVRNGVEDKVEPPVKAPLGDAARALQFVRSKAAEWNRVQTSCSLKLNHSCVALKRRTTLWCSIKTPFGRPVEPEVYMM